MEGSDSEFIKTDGLTFFKTLVLYHTETIYRILKNHFWGDKWI